LTPESWVPPLELEPDDEDVEEDEGEEELLQA
jgi:hypothetical protein